MQPLHLCPLAPPPFPTSGKSTSSCAAKVAASPVNRAEGRGDEGVRGLLGGGGESMKSKRRRGVFFLSEEWCLTLRGRQHRRTAFFRSFFFSGTPPLDGPRTRAHAPQNKKQGDKNGMGVLVCGEKKKEGQCVAPSPLKKRTTSRGSSRTVDEGVGVVAAVEVVVKRIRTIGDVHHGIRGGGGECVEIKRVTIYV